MTRTPHPPYRMGRLAVFAAAVVTSVAASVASGQPAVGPSALTLRLPDHRGKEVGLNDFAGDDLVVVAFLGTECPLAKLYSGRLQTLSEAYAERGVAFVGVMSNSQDSLEEITAFVHRHQLKFPVLKDRANETADRFHAERTPEVFLLDRDRRVRYRGRVDDQYVIGIARDEPTRHDLREAIDELLAGKDVATPSSKALGCVIGRVREPNPKSPVTYTRDIAPIVQQRCVECHREGQIGPFALRSYDDAAGWGGMIEEVVRQRRMPPWHANPEHGKFANDRSMPDSEKELIYQWVANGCPEGDPADLPAPRQFADAWQLPREPDVVVPMGDEPFVVPADAGPSGVPYQYFRTPVGFDHDIWIQAAEVRPGNRSVLHHTIVYVEPPGGSGRRDWVFLTAYVPGLRLDGERPQAAKRIPADSSLIFEQHYTPVGTEQTDITSIGLLFADTEAISEEIITTEIGNTRFRIPPREADHVVTASSLPVVGEMTLLSLSPHMHLRGKAFRYELVTPAGDRSVLLDVPAYDFNWQTRYVLAEPLRLTPGAVIHCRAVFDNSATNLANPNPEATVGWGDQSWDEMMLGYFDVVLPRDDARRPATKPVQTGLDVVGTFDLADADHDGALTAAEAAGRPMISQAFEQIDANGDGRVGLGELVRMLAVMRR